MGFMGKGPLASKFHELADKIISAVAKGGEYPTGIPTFNEIIMDESHSHDFNELLFIKFGKAFIEKAISKEIYQTTVLPFMAQHLFIKNVSTYDMAKEITRINPNHFSDNVKNLVREAVYRKRSFNRHYLPILSHLKIRDYDVIIDERANKKNFDLHGVVYQAKRGDSSAIKRLIKNSQDSINDNESVNSLRVDFNEMSKIRDNEITAYMVQVLFDDRVYADPDSEHFRSYASAAAQDLNILVDGVPKYYYSLINTDKSCLEEFKHMAPMRKWFKENKEYQLTKTKYLVP
jgi:hypothetical protein